MGSGGADEEGEGEGKEGEDTDGKLRVRMVRLGENGQ